MSTFALIPGAWHGAWCYEALARELEALGHRAVAVELPGEDPAAGLREYAAAAAAALEAAPPVDDVIAVGHSFGGITIPLLPELRPIAALVFLSAFVPRPGVSADDEFAAGEYALTEAGRGGREADELGRTRWIDARLAVDVLYNECAPGAAAEAAARLRPQGQLASSQPLPIERWPAVRSAYVHGSKDRMFGDLGLHLARERLGVEPVVLAADHSPMLSSPHELARALDEIAAG